MLFFMIDICIYNRKRFLAGNDPPTFRARMRDHDYWSESDSDSDSDSDTEKA